MDSFVQKFLFSFSEAWNLLFDFYPFASKTFDSWSSTITDVDDSTILRYVPIVGTALGIVAYLFVSAVCLLFGQLAAACLAPFFLVVFGEALTQGKDSMNTSRRLVSLFPYSISNDGCEKSLPPESLSLLAFVSILMMKGLCLAILIFYNRYEWIFVVIVLSCSLQASLVRTDNPRDKGIFLFADSRSEILMWGIAAFVCIVFNITRFPAPAVFVCFAGTVVASLLLKSLLRSFHLLSSESIGIAGKLMEIVLLFLGVSLLISH